MRKIVLAIAMMLAASTAGAVGPDARQYWALAAGYASLEELEFGVATALYGVELVPRIALEGRIGTSTEDEDVRIEYFGSALLRFNVLTDDVRPYILLGATHTQMRFSGPFASGSEDETDFSWGGGISVHTGNFGLQFEYIRYLDKHDSVLDGFNLGIINHF
jgi:hypothetical protein